MNRNQGLLFTPISSDIDGTKFADGNDSDDKHYWLTPPQLLLELQQEFGFTMDACPYPKPDDFDGLTCDWGDSTYVNPPFGSIMHEGRKKGPTAWARKAISESRKGKTVVMVYPLPKWVLMLLEAGAEVRNLGDVKWCATEDGTPGTGIGQHVACFILNREEPIDENDRPTPPVTIDQYQQEEIDVIAKHGDQRCLARTSNGAPWAMPCVLDRDHEGPCSADPNATYSITPVTKEPQ